MKGDVNWFELVGDKNINIKSNLIIFPYAGGGVSAFRNWGEKFSNTAIYVCQYPGRENRFIESAIRDIDILVEEVFIYMSENFDFSLPYYLFGYSMGTKILYELALKIRNSKFPNPRGLIISAGRAPCYKEPNPIYHLDDEGFIEGLRRYDGTPKEILDNRELIEIFLPTLRADFIIDEDYKDTSYEKVESDILGLMGDIDQEMTAEEMEKWKDYTSKGFTMKYIKGKHMFINTSEERVIVEVKTFIESYENI